MHNINTHYKIPECLLPILTMLKFTMDKIKCMHIYIHLCIDHYIVS